MQKELFSFSVSVCCIQTSEVWEILTTTFVCFLFRKTSSSFVGWFASVLFTAPMRVFKQQQEVDRARRDGIRRGWVSPKAADGRLSPPHSPKPYLPAVHRSGGAMSARSAVSCRSWDATALSSASAVYGNESALDAPRCSSSLIYEMPVGPRPMTTNGVSSVKKMKSEEAEKRRQLRRRNKQLEEELRKSIDSYGESLEVLAAERRAQTGTLQKDSRPDRLPSRPARPRYCRILKK